MRVIIWNALVIQIYQSWWKSNTFILCYLEPKNYSLWSKQVSFFQLLKPYVVFRWFNMNKNPENQKQKKTISYVVSVGTQSKWYNLIDIAVGSLWNAMRRVARSSFILYVVSRGIVTLKSSRLEWMFVKHFSASNTHSFLSRTRSQTGNLKHPNKFKSDK